jgi:thrombospondin type 3 repeat protein/H-type lectin domain-containing protein
MKRFSLTAVLLALAVILIMVIPTMGFCQDTDGDGYDDSVDCEPLDNLTYPGAREVCDGVDNQCPGDPGFGFTDTSCGCGGAEDLILVHNGGVSPHVFMESNSAFSIISGYYQGVQVHHFSADGNTLNTPTNIFLDQFFGDYNFSAAKKHTSHQYEVAWSNGWFMIVLPGDSVETRGRYLIPSAPINNLSLSINENNYLTIVMDNTASIDVISYDVSIFPGATMFESSTVLPSSTPLRVNSPYWITTDTKASQASANDNTFITAWSTYVSSNYSIRARRSDIYGNNNSDIFRVDQDPGSYIKGSPAIAIDKENKVIIAWVDERGVEGIKVYARRYNLNGVALGDEFIVSQGEVNNLYELAIATDKDNNFIIVWSGYSDYITARRYNSDGEAVGPEFVVSPLSYPEGLYPDIVIDNAGKFIITWESSAAGTVAYNPTMDSDCDGVLDAYENSSFGMGPIDPDTDGDGLCDGDTSIFDGPVLICLPGEDMNKNGIKDANESAPWEADTDNDGFSDGFEVDTLGSSPVLADTDGDGLSDWEEKYIWDTDLTRADSDGDNISDYDEIMLYLTDPHSADTDGDGLSDYLEQYISGSDPLDPDSDDDGIPDGKDTDINLSDTDADGTPNAWENIYSCIDAAVGDSLGDEDSDGLSNLEEFLNGSDPCVSDTDGDGLDDGDEVNTSNTNPANPDTDGDGLTDGDEVNAHSTDPLDADSDDDGYSDGAEIAAGTLPNDPMSFPASSSHLINYQGRLMDDLGIVVGGTVNMTFAIFDVLSGGTELWSETHNNVVLQGGIYNVLLGDVEALGHDIFTDHELYLEVTVGAEALSPRKRITSVPYAIKSEGLMGGRFEIASRDLAIGTPVASVTIHVSFNREFVNPPLVWVSSLSSQIGSMTFVDTLISNITADGFDVTFQSLSGNASSGSATFTYGAFGN